MLRILACLVFFAALARGAPVQDGAYASSIAQADAVLSKMADERLIGGIAAVLKAGRIVFAAGYGYANEELEVPLDPSQIIQIGSNTKFYTATAIYQLQEQGLLNVSDPVNGYIDPEDFGLNGTWCPLIHGREDEGCQEPTFQQLLSMNSGALPVSNQACGDGKPGWTEADWYWQYRLLAAPTTYGAMTYEVLTGTFSPADALNFANWMHLPFQTAPGEKYCYVNNNFVLAAYIVEKLSGVPFADYITQHIFEAANMTDTYVWTGGRGAMPTGLRKGEVSAPGYLATFSNATAADLPSFQMVQRASSDFMPATIPVATQGTGDVVSSVADVAKFYDTLVASPETLGLSREASDEMAAPRQLMPVAPLGSTFYFGQGVGVHEYADSNVSALEYKGELWGIATSIRFFPIETADGFANDAVLFFSNYQSAVPPQPDGSCAVLAAGGEPLTLDPAFCAGGDVNNFVLGVLSDAFGVDSNSPGGGAPAPVPELAAAGSASQG